jgi:hypothetical protein
MESQGSSRPQPTFAEFPLTQGIAREALRKPSTSSVPLYAPDVCYAFGVPDSGNSSNVSLNCVQEVSGARCLCLAGIAGKAPLPRSAAVTLTLRTMNRHAQLMGWGDHWVRTIMWCLIKADQSGASTKRYTATPSGAGQSTRVRTRRRRRTMASPTTLDAAKEEFKTRYEEMKRMGVRPFS